MNKIDYPVSGIILQGKKYHLPSKGENSFLGNDFQTDMILLLKIFILVCCFFLYLPPSLFLTHIPLNILTLAVLVAHSLQGPHVCSVYELSLFHCGSDPRQGFSQYSYSVTIDQLPVCFLKLIKPMF